VWCLFFGGAPAAGGGPNDARTILGQAFIAT
jgi:hypothetical protein